MKMVYGTNIWTHHQLPVATELARILGADCFKMVLFNQVDDERRKLGWAQENALPSWVLGPPRSDKERSEIIQQSADADVMIFGACPRGILERRVAANKLTLVASERLLKKSYHRLRMLNPRYARGFAVYRKIVNHDHIHALAIGHYAPHDLRAVGAFGDRLWRWGYFVELNPEPPPPIIDRPLQVLWVGRMLKWKKVSTLLRAIALVHHEKWFGGCTIVGDGPEHTKLLSLSRKLGLDSDSVRFLPPVTFEVVRRLMQESDVYVMPSNQMEGWGAVIGESMSEGCLVVANEDGGSARALISDSESGFLFRDGDWHQLANILNEIASNPTLRIRIRQQAWEWMHSRWSPRVAAERLVSLCEGLLRGVPPDHSDGPCSRIRSALLRSNY